MNGTGAAVRAASELPTGAFGNDPWWLVIVKALVVFVFLLLMTLFTIWFERRVVGRMQQRLGPNRHGPFGLLQPLADGMKAMLKEEIMPKAVDKPVFLLAPALAAGAAFLTFGVIPFGPEVSIFGHHTMLQLADLNVAVLYVLAGSSIGIYGIVLAGWSSGSTYPLLGALRSSAQMISYEVAMGLSLAAVFLWSGSMSTSEIVAAQGRIWFAIVLIPSFLVYAIAMVGETNRAPFDLPEGESELVGGFQTEYSGFRFAMFYLAEYINMINASALATTLFLGGWRAPFPLSLWSGANAGWWPVLWFVAKLVVVLFVFVWLRGTLPRMRYDQFMALGWKLLIPVSLGWVLLVALVRVMNNEGWSLTARIITIAAIAAAFLVLSSLGGVLARTRDEPVFEPDDVGAMSPDYRSPEFGPRPGGSYPVPPLPGQEPEPFPPPVAYASAPSSDSGASLGGGPGTTSSVTSEEDRPRG